jgi:hypothetical protein
MPPEPVVASLSLSHRNGVTAGYYGVKVMNQSIETTLYMALTVSLMALVLGGCSVGAELRGARVALEIKPHEAFQARSPDYDRDGLTKLIEQVQ